MRRHTILTILLLAGITAVSTKAQTYNSVDTSGNINQYDDNGTFNPNRRDSTKTHKKIPRGVKAWRIDRRFGDVIPTELDTMPHLYQNSIYATGLYGEYNTLGSNYTPRQNRIFTDRADVSDFFFTQPYDYMTREPDQFLFLNTLSPYTNISYDNCGDKQNGEDHIQGKFAVNANKQLGFGFDLDYHYARGYYQNQSNAHFRASLFTAYRGDRYQAHLLVSFYHRKQAENGGIMNDNYIVHPEMEAQEYSENEIPTLLQQNWNRNNSQHVFLSHRYNIGFYRQVKMTDEEIKARQFAAASAKQKKEKEEKEKNGNEQPQGKGKQQPSIPAGRPAGAKIMGDEPLKKADGMAAADTTRIKVDSKETMDSLLAAQARQDSIDATMKREYVPVTSIIHTLELNNYDRIYQAYVTPGVYYLNTYYNYNDEQAYAGDSIYDKTKYLSIKNTVALALLEGFNKYAKAGLKAYLSFENRRFQMPDLRGDSTSYYMNRWTGNCLNIGAQISKTQGRTLHFNLQGELGVTGMDAGRVAVDFHTDLNFPLLGDTVQLAANAYFHRTPPRFFQENYHSKHLWWDQSLSSETRSHLEGLFTFRKTHTQLRVAVDAIQNYTYFGTSYEVGDGTRRYMTAGVYQASGNINVLTAQLRQDLRWGVLNWENIITYQNSSNEQVLALPTVNVFTNLYLKFRIARVLAVELGGCCTIFSKYYAPDYVPAIGQYAVQQNSDSHVTLGGYPFIDVYANMHLKRARFFVAMSHVNAGSGSRMQFLTPHYPTNNRVLHLGVSWNFYN